MTPFSTQISNISDNNWSALLSNYWTEITTETSLHAQTFSLVRCKLMPSVNHGTVHGETKRLTEVNWHLSYFFTSLYLILFVNVCKTMRILLIEFDALRIITCCKRRFCFIKKFRFQSDLNLERKSNGIQNNLFNLIQCDYYLFVCRNKQIILTMHSEMQYDM